jgi:hypothetical protein
MTTLKNLILVALVAAGSSLVFGCGAAPDSPEAIGHGEEAVAAGGRCDRSTTCCYHGWSQAPGQCFYDLQALGCAGSGPAVGRGSVGYFFDVGCPLGTSAPASCVPYGVRTVASFCTSSDGYDAYLAVDPTCGGGCWLIQ